MTGKLDKFLEHKSRPISVEELQAEIAQEESMHFCVLEVICYGLRGLEVVWELNEHGVIVGQTYTCGFIPAGTVQGCPQRRRLMKEIEA